MHTLQPSGPHSNTLAVSTGVPSYPGHPDKNSMVVTPATASKNRVFLPIWFIACSLHLNKLRGERWTVNQRPYSKLWKKYTFSGPQKFFIGLSLLAAGFGVLALGSNNISSGAAVASISMMWLIFAYLLHTMGELAVSPVGLSYVSKLAPARMLGFIFAIWYVFIGMAGKISSVFAEFSESILQTDGWSYFFLIFTIIPFVAGLIILALNRPIKRMMHGVDK